MQPQNQQDPEQTQSQTQTGTPENIRKKVQLYRIIFNISLTVVIICIALAGLYIFDFAGKILNPAVAISIFVVALITAAVSGILSQATKWPATKSDDNGQSSASPAQTNHILNVILIGIVWSFLGAVAFVILLFITAPPTGSDGATGHGMMILFVIPIILGICFLSVAYMIVGWFGIIRSHYTHQKIAERHRVVIIPITIIGLITAILSSYNWVIAPALQNYKDGHYTGPTSSQIAAVKMGNFAEAQQRLTYCYVYYINYEQYDTNGPLRLNNAYIKINMQGIEPIDASDTTDQNIYVPDDINLPVSDRNRLKTAVDEKNKHREGDSPSCAKEILFDSDYPS